MTNEAAPNTMDPYCGCDAEGHDGPCATPVGEAAAGLDVEHEHAWGPKKGYARMVALGIAHKWPELVQVCMVCGAVYEGEQ